MNTPSAVPDGVNYVPCLTSPPHSPPYPRISNDPSSDHSSGISNLPLSTSSAIPSYFRHPPLLARIHQVDLLTSRSPAQFPNSRTNAIPSQPQSHSICSVAHCAAHSSPQLPLTRRLLYELPPSQLPPIGSLRSPPSNISPSHSLKPTSYSSRISPIHIYHRDGSTPLSDPDPDIPEKNQRPASLHRAFESQSHPAFPSQSSAMLDNCLDDVPNATSALNHSSSTVCFLPPDDKSGCQITSSSCVDLTFMPRQAASQAQAIGLRPSDLHYRSVQVEDLDDLRKLHIEWFPIT